jgi:hypothetical protein
VKGERFRLRLELEFRRDGVKVSSLGTAFETDDVFVVPRSIRAVAGLLRSIERPDPGATSTDRKG